MSRIGLGLLLLIAVLAALALTILLTDGAKADGRRHP